MIKILLRSNLIYLFVLFLASCSSNNLEIITKDSTTSLDNSLVVMRINWIDSYYYDDKKENGIIVSSDLLKKTDLFEKREVNEGEPELYGYLYYLNSFSFIFQDGSGKEQRFVRFGKDLRQYEPVAIYQFTPGEVSLGAIETYEEKLSSSQLANQRDGRMEYWSRSKVIYEDDFGRWDLPKGKIAYLGDLTFYYHTKRMVLGWFPPKKLVESIVLEKIELKDGFDETRVMLAEQKPWFPADGMINLSMDKVWVYNEAPEQKEVKPESDIKTDQTEQQPQKNRDNSFF